MSVKQFENKINIRTILIVCALFALGYFLIQSDTKKQVRLIISAMQQENKNVKIVVSATPKPVSHPKKEEPIKQPGPIVTITETDAKTPKQTRVLRWKGNEWVQQKDFCMGKYNYDKILLKTPRGQTPMYIHPIEKDSLISAAMKRNGIWEGQNVVLYKTLLEKEPEAGLIDVGSHLGQYSLYTAKMGRKAIAIDPLQENVRRFCKSVQEGNLTGSVTIFFAGVSNSHKKVSFRGDPDNVAGTRISQEIAGATTSGNYSNFISESSILDDMLGEIHFKKAILKIDVEGHEYQVLRAADKIFKNVDIRHIIMEWAFVGPTPEDGENLVKLLSGYGYKPFGIGGKQLDPRRYRYWPWDVHWVKLPVLKGRARKQF